MTEAQPGQTTCISFFTYPWRNSLWGMRQMRDAYRKFESLPGLQFMKMLGSGGGDGFSLWPNFKQYGMLTVWDDASQATAFSKSNLTNFYHRADTGYTILMQPVKVHGEWSGQCPFSPGSATVAEDQPLAVITRASIKPGKALTFWWQVPGASKSLTQHPDHLFAVGIGEVPLLEQATFSVWKSGAAMKEFAYTNKAHSKVIRQTRELQWYKEEMFARFTLLATYGLPEEHLLRQLDLPHYSL